jgi:hypothetical protein
MANQLELQLEVNTEALEKGLNQADRAVTKFAGNFVGSFAPITGAVNKAAANISSAFGKSFKDIASGVAVGNLVANGIQSAASAITGFLTGSVAAAAEQEDAINKLSQALRASGQYSKAAVDDFAAFASAMQKASLFGDEVVIGQLAIAKSFGATNEEAKKLVQAAANMAATFGGSLEERVQQLGKTMDGSAGKLAKFVPELKGLSAEALKAGGAADVINQKFGGAAASQLDTYSGSVTSMKNALSDFQEELGGTVTGSGYFREVLAGVTLAFQNMTQAMADSKIAAEREAGTLVESASSVDQLKRSYDDLTLELLKYEDVINRAKEPKNMVNVGDLDIARVKVKGLKDEMDLMRASIEEAQKKASAASADAAIAMVNKPKEADPLSQDEQKKAEKALADKAALQAAMLQQEADFEAYRAQLILERNDLSEQQRITEYETILEAEYAKVEAVKQAELAKAKLIEDAGVRKAQVDAINQKADIDRQKATLKQEKDISAEKVRLARTEADTKLGIAANFVQAGLAISKEGSLAQKALAITAATISTYQGATNALADTRPAYLAPAMAASIVAIGLANVARIAGAKFEQGGIVGGASMHGDKIPAFVNSGEMILNRQQQGEMFRQLNGSGGSSSGVDMTAIIEAIRNMPIVVEANGREIARLIRDERANGFAF